MAGNGRNGREWHFPEKPGDLNSTSSKHRKVEVRIGSTKFVLWASHMHTHKTHNAHICTQ